MPNKRDTSEARPLQREHQKGRIEIAFRKAAPIEAAGYPGFAPGVRVEGGIRIESDVAVKLRDGTTIYTDIYRPEGAKLIPAIVSWSPYGKTQGLAQLKGLPPGNGGVPEGVVSPMAKVEGPDPAYWCKQGYAVINPDARGAFKSEGDVLYFGTGEGRDSYDLIEWVAGRDWSNGKVGMSGTSWLAIAQWFTAAERPPHLAALAPCEGLTDLYRDSVGLGGIPEVGFHAFISEHYLPGERLVEDVVSMIQRYPLMNEYWEDKIARVENITIPTYVVASWTNGLHSQGTLAGFERLASPEKWLRVHNTWEWPDYYDPSSVEDLRRFFDRYLKGVANGWEQTPRVRLSVLDPGGQDEVNRPEREWPLARTRYEKLYLDARAKTLSPEPLAQEATARYAADAQGQARFTLRCTRETELTGYMKLRLWVEAEGADDLDLFVAVQKVDEQGQLVPTYVLGKPHPGAVGWMRVSHRELDPERSTPAEPYHTHRREELLRSGEIVPVDIAIWPTSMLWHAGQRLSVAVAGHSLWKSQPGPFSQSPMRYLVRNRGHHIIHTGGKFDSYLLVPRIDR